MTRLYNAFLQRIEERLKFSLKDVNKDPDTCESVAHDDCITCFYRGLKKGRKLP